MKDKKNYIHRLEQSNPLREPVIQSAIKSLKLSKGSSGLDIGCGIGLQTLLLARAVGAEGHVTGLDISPEFLAYAEEKVKNSSLSKRISFQQGDVTKLLFKRNTFDWVWSSDCLGYPVGDLFPVLQTLRKIVKPGGKVVIIGWSSQQLLPGYPLIEAWLNATCSGLIPIVEGKEPGQHFLRAPDAYRRAGFVNISAKTLIGDVHAPLSETIRTAMISLFDMLWGIQQTELSQEYWWEYQRLCYPESPDFILDLPDYYAFFTYTMFLGEGPKK